MGEDMTAIPSPSATRPPGRPPSPETREAILDATLDLLVERGYAGLSMDAVAERARSGKSTIYRHWRSRAALVVEALNKISHPPSPRLDGTLRENLVWRLEDFIALSRRTHFGQVIAGLAEARFHDPQLDELLQELIGCRRTECEIIFRTAVDRGELPPDTDTSLATDLAMSPLILREILGYLPLTADLPEKIADRVLRALAASPPPTSA